MRFFEEIAAREDRNLYEIVLYPEGLFYKAYERSAFACVSRVSPFKPSKKHIKYCARDMVSVGFPAAVLSKYFPAAPRPLADGRVVVALTDRIDPAACEMWKASLPLKERQPRGSVRRAGFVLSAVSGAPGGFVAGAEKILPGFAAAGAPNVRGGLRTQGEAAVSAGSEPILPNMPGNQVSNGRSALPDMPGARTGRETEETRAERAVRMIREFRLEAATPVECVLFVADLKKEIDGYL